MLDISNTTRPTQTVMVLRLSNQDDHYCPYAATLKEHGIRAIEDLTPEAANLAVRTGCRVGLVILQHEADIQRLESCEHFLNSSKVSWVGLIAPELISTARVRQFIGDYLFNFLTLPANPDHVVLALRHAWGMAFVRDSYRRPVNDVIAEESEQVMVGNSPQMQRLFTQIRKVARTDASVLITGPSGTGKELAALSVHRQSDRKNGPFIAVNCGAIAPQLFQSELFGYEKGAFTGALQRRIGRIEAAKDGTLFLDEIGDMPLDMQVNLLRFLQEKTIVRVGGTQALPVDARVIAATHIDLAEAVKQGRFREDLYYRINVVCIQTPRLADRGTDIDNLALYYFNKFSRLYQKNLRGFSKAAIDAMSSHSWPGNVRELVNRVQRAVVMAEGRLIQPDDLGFTRQLQPMHLMSLEDARATADRVMIRRAMMQARNQISHAASLLGVSRVTLYRLIEKYDIRERELAKPVTSLLNRTDTAQASPSGTLPSTR